MKLVIIILIIILFLRKNCKNKKEGFKNIPIFNSFSQDRYFKNLQNDIIQKQQVRNLLF